MFFRTLMVLGLSQFLAPAVIAETYRDTSVPMQTVQSLDLNRYLGKWYEIARFPNRFELNCVGVTAEYFLRKDGKVRVLNSCRKNTLDGELEQADGQASVKAPGKLSVTFVPWLPFAKGDYWVLHLNSNYSLAVVGEPKGKTGWILSRTPTIDVDSRNLAENILRKNGYDITELYYVPQQ